MVSYNCLHAPAFTQEIQTPQMRNWNMNIKIWLNCTGKLLPSAFWNGEVEGEWRDYNPDFRTAQDRELFMDIVDRKRAVTTYERTHCSDAKREVNMRYCLQFLLCWD